MNELQREVYVITCRCPANSLELQPLFFLQININSNSERMTRRVSICIFDSLVSLVFSIVDESGGKVNKSILSVLFITQIMTTFLLVGHKIS